MNDENREVYVPYIVHEGVQVRLERTIKRLVCALILTILLLFASNALWVWYISGCDIETYDYVQDGVGVNIIGSRNGVDYDVPEVGYSENSTQKESETKVDPKE